MASHQRLTVYAAVAANAAIAITKFIAAAVTSSSALLSEGIHSAVDTGDGLFLALGLYLSRRPATARHPYGHGLEVYFWSMVVAMSMFGLGGGMSIWEGVQHIADPHPLENAAWLYSVLGIAFLLVTVAIILGRETWSLLTGEAANRELVERIQHIAEVQPAVIEARMPHTMHFGPERRVHPEVQRVSLRFPA